MLMLFGSRIILTAPSVCRNGFVWNFLRNPSSALWYAVRRIQRAYDKTNGYDFFIITTSSNTVLVGLTRPVDQRRH